MFASTPWRRAESYIVCSDRVCVTLVSGFAQEESRDTLRTDTSGQTNAVIATVPVGRLPGSLVASPDGTLVYVTSEFSNSISAIDTATNRVAFTIPLSGTPFHLAISPDSRTLYCTLIGNNAILLISTATKQISQTFATGTSPQTVAVSPDGNTGYVPNYVGTVTVIRQGVLQAPIHVGGNPTLVAFTLDGSYAYVTNETPSNSVSVIKVATQKVVSTIKSQVPYPFGGMAVAPDWRNIYLAGINNSGYPVAAVIDTYTDTITSTIVIRKHQHQPGSPAITPDGSYLYVPLGTVGRFAQPGHKVVPINLATNRPSGYVITGNQPTAVAITPNGKYAYVSNYLDATVSVIAISPN